MGCYASANEEDDRQSPDWRDGSNLYFSLWFSFFSACWIVIKWRDSGADGGVYDEKQRQHQRQHINMLETTQVHHSPPHYHHHHHSGHASAGQSEVTSMNIRLGDE